MLTRPDLEEVLRYREAVDAAVSQHLEEGSLASPLLEVLELGLHHEQQHQELVLTDVVHLLSRNLNLVVSTKVVPCVRVSVEVWKVTAADLESNAVSLAKQVTR